MSNKNTKRMDDGFSTIITFENIPEVKIFEKEVTPPGFSAGGAIDTTTMRNVKYRTNSPKALTTLTATAATVAYATEALDQIRSQIGIIQQITVTFPDKSTIVSWGWLDSFTPSSHQEGSQPTAAMSIQPSNHDNDGNEVEPLYTAGPDDSDSSDS